jgi:hypothetical protein
MLEAKGANEALSEKKNKFFSIPPLAWGEPGGISAPRSLWVGSKSSPKLTCYLKKIGK